MEYFWFGIGGIIGAGGMWLFMRSVVRHNRASVKTVLDVNAQLVSDLAEIRNRRNRRRERKNIRRQGKKRGATIGAGV